MNTSSSWIQKQHLYLSYNISPSSPTSFLSSFLQVSLLLSHLHLITIMLPFARRSLSHNHHVPPPFHTPIFTSLLHHCVSPPLRNVPSLHLYPPLLIMSILNPHLHPHMQPLQAAIPFLTTALYPHGRFLILLISLLAGHHPLEEAIEAVRLWAAEVQVRVVAGKQGLAEPAEVAAAFGTCHLVTAIYLLRTVDQQATTHKHISNHKQRKLTPKIGHVLTLTCMHDFPQSS